MKTKILLLISILPMACLAQVTLEWNAWLDTELSQGQMSSHFYYNQIHRDKTDWRVGVSDINLMTELKLTPAWSINIRGQLDRNQGLALEQFRMPLANITYSPEKQNWSLALGRFITPFASFAEKQHSKDRVFVNLPLSFSHYVNISSQVGFAEQLGERPYIIDEEADWGTTMLYYGAYSNGLRWDWSIVPDKVDWSLALTSSAVNIFTKPFDFDNWGVVTKLKFQPTYFWQQQVSFSRGTFVQSSSFSERIEIPFAQTLLGTDFVLGYGFWELTGEVIGAFYDVPQYISTEDRFAGYEEAALRSTYLGLNLKYETPFLSGLYLAYGIEQLSFGELDINTKWDNKVVRHNFGAGYKITDFLLLRSNYMLQSVENHPVWEQNTWRTTLTIFY